MFGITDHDFNLADVATVDMTATDSATTVPNITTGGGGFATTVKEVVSDVREFIPSSTVTMAALNILKYVIPSLKCNPASTAIGAVCILLNKEEKLSRRMIFATLFIIASQLTLISGIPFAQPLFMAVSAYQHGTLLMHAFAGLTIASAIYEIAKGSLGSKSASAASSVLQPGLSQVAQTGGNLLMGATGSGVVGSLFQGAPSLGPVASSVVGTGGLLYLENDDTLNWLSGHDPQEFEPAFDGKSSYYEAIDLKTTDALESLHTGLTETSLQSVNRDWGSEIDSEFGTNIPQVSLSDILAEQWGNEYENFIPGGLNVFPKGFEEAWTESGRRGKKSNLLGTAATVLAVGSVAAIAYQNREEIKKVATKTFNWISVVFGDDSDKLSLEV